ncbi:MAG: PAS domain-containing protein, partial [Chitinophagaceae bacterium]
MTKTYDELVSRIEELEAQVTESHEIIEAIRKGEVDAFVVKSDDQHELYTLKSADKSYRIFFEQMNEGALTINEDNIILYSNSRFASLLNAPLETVIGFNLFDFIPEKFVAPAKELVKTSWEKGESKGEIVLGNKETRLLPLLFSMNRIELE